MVNQNTNQMSSLTNSQMNNQMMNLNKKNKNHNRKFQVKQYRYTKKLRRVHNSSIYRFFMGLAIFYIIFSDSFRRWIFEEDSDDIFFSLSVISFILLLFELFLTVSLIDQYYKSYIFVIEVINVLSIILDIGWVYQYFYFCDGCSNFDNFNFSGRFALKNESAMFYISTMDYLRLLRLFYFCKFGNFFSYLKNKYFNIKTKRENKKVQNYIKLEDSDIQQIEQKFDYKNQLNNHNKDTHKFINPRINDFDIQHYRKIFDTKNYFDKDGEKKTFHYAGQELSEGNIYRILAITLFLIILIPLFHPSTYQFTFSGFESSFIILGQFARDNSNDLISNNFTSFEDIAQTYISKFNNFSDIKMLGLYLYQSKDLENSNIILKQYVSTIPETELIKNKRQYEFFTNIYPPSKSSINFNEIFVTTVMDSRSIVIQDAWLNILRILTVSLIMFFIAFFIDRDIRKLIVKPMTDMNDKIKRIQKNPVEASKQAKEQYFKDLIIRQKDAWRRLQYKEEQKYETSLLIETLQNSGNLLALGLGEAGTEIIIKNLVQDKINPLIPGKKVICIFGFCDIKYFGQLTEILKNKVFKYVNGIAKIVQFEVDKYAGSCNKNLGDAFLLVWKFPKEDLEEIVEYDDEGKEKINISLKKFVSENNPVSKRCELAVLSFLKILMNVQRSKKAKKYNNNQLILSYIPEFKVQMNFGLHIGWGIEGAIGSERKIDTSYLSPNVNLASRLDAASKQYNVPMLISGQVFNKLSKDVQNQFRHVDTIYVKGSKQAMEIHTYDLFLKDIPRKLIFLDELDCQNYPEDMKNKILLDYRKKVKFFHKQTFEKGQSVKKLLISDQDLRMCRKKFTKNFFTTWKQGFQAYLDGNWEKAKSFFQQTEFMIPGQKDGPSRTLLNYMRNRNYIAPESWHGVRKLTSK